MYLVYVWSDSIEKYAYGNIIKSVDKEQLSKAINKWDIFEDVKLRQKNPKDVNDFSYYTVEDEFLCRRFAEQISNNYLELLSKQKLFNGGYDMIFEFTDDQFVDYYVGIQHYDFVE